MWQGRTDSGKPDQNDITFGTSSNNYGFYSLTLPNDTVLLRCSYVGHASEEVTFVLREDTVINWASTDALLAEVMVTSAAVRPLEQPTLNLPVPVADLLTTPVLFGEVDLLKSLQRLPGVQSGVDGGAGLYVRGSGPDQNLLLLNGVPLYNASHLFGFFSVFNADAINNVDFYGGLPSALRRSAGLGGQRAAARRKPRKVSGHRFGGLTRLAAHPGGTGGFGQNLFSAVGTIRAPGGSQSG